MQNTRLHSFLNNYKAAPLFSCHLKLICRYEILHILAIIVNILIKPWFCYKYDVIRTCWNIHFNIDDFRLHTSNVIIIYISCCSRLYELTRICLVLLGTMLSLDFFSFCEWYGNGFIPKKPKSTDEYTSSPDFCIHYRLDSRQI